MDDCYGINKSAARANEPFHKGQKILYKGEDAHVIEVEPVLTIRIDDKYHVICGNLLDEIRPSVSDADDAQVVSTLEILPNYFHIHPGRPLLSEIFS